MPPGPPVSASGSARKLVALEGDANPGEGGEVKLAPADTEVLLNDPGRLIGTYFRLADGCAASLAARSEKFTTARAVATPGTPSISVGGSFCGSGGPA